MTVTGMTPEIAAQLVETWELDPAQRLIATAALIAIDSLFDSIDRRHRHAILETAYRVHLELAEDELRSERLLVRVIAWTLHLHARFGSTSTTSSQASGAMR